MRRGKRRSALVALAVVLAIPAAASAGGVPIIVEPSPGQNRFSPDHATTAINSPTFHFHWDNVGTTLDSHNVRQDDRLFRSGAPTDHGDYGVAPSAGTYHYYCEVHGFRSGGMDGVLKVRPIFDEAPAGRPFTVIWASSVNSGTGGAFDVRFKRGTGHWRIWKDDTTRYQAVFGKHRRPLRVRPNQVYKFQARSEKKSSRSKRSDWSPTLVVSS